MHGRPQTTLERVGGGFQYFANQLAYQGGVIKKLIYPLQGCQAHWKIEGFAQLYWSYLQQIKKAKS
jgi:hypothetical protein